MASALEATLILRFVSGPGPKSDLPTDEALSIPTDEARLAIPTNEAFSIPTDEALSIPTNEALSTPLMRLGWQSPLMRPSQSH